MALLHNFYNILNHQINSNFLKFGFLNVTPYSEKCLYKNFMLNDFNVALCFILISFLFHLYNFPSFYFAICFKRRAQWVTEQEKKLTFEYIKFKLQQLIRLHTIFTTNFLIWWSYSMVMRSCCSTMLKV